MQLTLLRTLILWTLSSSDTVKAFVTSNYKNRQTDDINIPLSVQPWGSDSNKRRYFLIEGIDDTSFRVYRESNPAGLNRTWWSVAGSIDELKVLAEKLNTEDGGPKARQLAQKMLNSVPRFEATEEVRTICPPRARDTRSLLTCFLETSASRVPPDAQGAVQAPRAWLLAVRRSHER